MAIRDLMVSINFTTDTGTLEAVNSSVDNLVTDMGTLGSTGDTALSTVSNAAISASSRISDLGNKAQEVGKKLTTHITTPVLSAITAVGGLTTALGFKRLVGMDNAQAKLKGLGYEGQAVEAIMNDVNAAVTGTTHTMAEGVDVAAGALAAGVEQGAELERYITLVGDAATGSNRPMSEMAQIFNRIQGSGKLMTDELNTIEHGMPGFSKAMSEHLGVAPDEFRKMVTEGKVTADQFLDVMEDFAGGMSDAYAETWSGMVKNVMANIGIIGEALIGGLFEDGKKGLAEFLDVLRSDEIKEWATETGERIREVANDIVDIARDIKSFWDGLPSPIQNVIKNIALFGTIAITAIGPLLIIFGKILSAVSPLIGFFSKLAGVVKWFGALLNPVTLIAGAIIGLIAGIAALIIYWDNIKESIYGLNPVLDMIIDAVENFAQSFMEFMRAAIDFISEAWNQFATVLVSVWDWLVQQGVQLWETYGEQVLTVLQTAWELIGNAFTLLFDFISDLFAVFTALFRGDWEGLWNAIIELAVNFWNNLVDLLVSLWNYISELFMLYAQVISGIMTTIWDIIVSIWNTILNSVVSILTSIWNTVVNIFTSIVNAISTWMNNAYNTIVNIWNNVMSFFRGIDLFQIGKNIIQGLINGISSMAEAVWNTVKNIASGITNTISSALGISSPARVLIEMGHDIGDGLQIGIDDSAMKVAESASRLADAAYPDAHYIDNYRTPRTYTSQNGNVVFSPNITINANGQGESSARSIKKEVEKIFPSLMSDFIRVVKEKR